MRRTGRRATFGELAAAAARLPPPAQVRAQGSQGFQARSGQELPRLDRRAKTDGSARFTLDVSLPGMLTALIARPPLFGATVKSFDASAARQVNGVTHVVHVPSGVAVVARGSGLRTRGARRCA